MDGKICLRYSLHRRVGMVRGQVLSTVFAVANSHQILPGGHLYFLLLLNNDQRTIKLPPPAPTNADLRHVLFVSGLSSPSTECLSCQIETFFDMSHNLSPHTLTYLIFKHSTGHATVLQLGRHVCHPYARMV